MPDSSHFLTDLWKLTRAAVVLGVLAGIFGALVGVAAVLTRGLPWILVVMMAALFGVPIGMSYWLTALWTRWLSGRMRRRMEKKATSIPSGDAH